MDTEKRFTPSCYTVGRILGDAEVRESTNGKSYRIIPVELVGGRKASAFCYDALDQGMFVMVRVQPRDSGFSYCVFGPTPESVAFLTEACTDWSYLNDEND